ncbi:equilibrative nucleoside transporter 3-like isoform X2 [Corticium candelabrum]|uniref:equilibrative nucleoside transporter 3-like isoform X2 n=1 Tax=Corticium candelabrum TaxID=121492 RepID=UPI002E25C5B7|nr:equilibrative nucleoside transporter 3-like isoform X2 [Corticium candelabrum]
METDDILSSVEETTSSTVRSNTSNLLVNDTYDFNFNDVDTTSEKLQLLAHHEGPRDRFSSTYFIFFAFGIGSFLPWTVFIMAGEYFDLKLWSANSTSDNLENTYESYVSAAAQSSNVTFLLVNVYITHRFTAKIRIYSALLSMLLLLLSTVVFVYIDTSQWRYQFFGITMVTIVAVNAAGAFFLGGIVGIAGMMPPKYTQAVLAGQGVAGMITSFCQVFSLLGSGGTRAVLSDSQKQRSALGYFLSSSVFIAFCLFLFRLLHNLPFAVHHFENSKNSNINTSVGDGQERKQPTQPKKWEVFKQIRKPALAVLLTSLATVFVYPAVGSLVRSTAWSQHRCQVHRNDSLFRNTTYNTSSGTAWTCTYFTPVGCFLLYNVGNAVGRLFPRCIHKQCVAYACCSYLHG